MMKVDLETGSEKTDIHMVRWLSMEKRLHTIEGDDGFQVSGGHNETR